MFLMLTTLAFAGCQESNPSRTIVLMEIDSDGESTWIYLYTTPRVRMDNLTITFNEDSETFPSVFSHNRFISKETMSNITDSDGYFVLLVSADLSNVYWEYSCMLRIIVTTESEGDLVSAEVILTDITEETQEVWELPYNIPLEYAT